MKIKGTCLICDTALVVSSDGQRFVYAHELGALDHEPELEIQSELERLCNRMRTAELGLSMGGPSAFMAGVLEPVVSQLEYVLAMLRDPGCVSVAPGVVGVANPLGVDFLVSRMDIPDDLSGLEGL